MLVRVAHASDQRARVWRGSGIPAVEQGLKVLGTPLGHPEYVADQLEQLTAEHLTLLDRIPAIPDLQCAWAADEVG